MIDWNKPIEYRSIAAAKWYQARVICKDRKTNGLTTRTHILLYHSEACEHTCVVTPEGTIDGAECVRNVKEKKKYWTYVLKDSYGLYTKLSMDDKAWSVGQTVQDIGRNATVVNILEGEYEI
jgi:hypothetical protein